MMFNLRKTRPKTLSPSLKKLFKIIHRSDNQAEKDE